MNIKRISVEKILRVYRYLSLILTSIFYFLGIHQHSIEQRIIVVGSSLITALTMDYLYCKSRQNNYSIKLFLIVEIIGNCIILIPSGGVESPYIWYIINTLLMARIELTRSYFWGNSILYLGVMIVTEYVMQASMLLQLEQLNMLVGFVLITFAIEILGAYAENSKAKEKQAKDNLDYAMKIYETTTIVTGQQEEEGVIKVILDYITQQLKVNKALIILNKDNQQQCIFRGISEEEKEYLAIQVEEKVRSAYRQKNYLKYYGKGFIGVPIVYAYRYFGIILVEGTQYQKSIEFLAHLAGLIFKKFEIELINQDLSLNQEQNRIANEIHDSVLQRLFAVSCKAFVVAKQTKDEKIQEELQIIRNEITEAMSELRSTIYGLSWNKDGVHGLLEKIEDYIACIEKLYNVYINFNVHGELEGLSLEKQKVLYRITCEAISNGIRHGKAKNIQISLKIAKEGVSLTIEDDGKGFDYKQVLESSKVGLGLRNMEQLTQGLGGALKLQSEGNKGTKIEIEIPKNRVEVGIA